MLAAETGETAVISRRVGLAAIGLYQQPSTHPLRSARSALVTARVGALGRVLRPAPPGVQEEVLASGSLVALPSPAAGLAAIPGQDLAGIVADGIAVSEGELIAGTVGIAVPVVRDDGIVAAVGILAPAARATAAWRIRSSGLAVAAGAGLARALSRPG
jgi:DNA-binding IclR family transcriptional regulator